MHQQDAAMFSFYIWESQSILDVFSIRFVNIGFHVVCWEYKENPFESYMPIFFLSKLWKLHTYLAHWGSVNKRHTGPLYFSLAWMVTESSDLIISSLYADNMSVCLSLACETDTSVRIRNHTYWLNLKRKNLFCLKDKSF